MQRTRKAAIALALLMTFSGVRLPALSEGKRAPSAQKQAPASPERPAPFGLDTAKPLLELNEVFRQDSKWRGADGASSIALDKKTALWFFCDTFVLKSALGEEAEKQPTSSDKPDANAHAKPAKKKHKLSAEDFLFIHNSAARYDLTKRRANFLYGTADGAAVLTPQANSGAAKSWYWPGAGLFLNGKLYVMCKRAVALTDKEAGPVTWSSDECAVVDHPDLPANQWRTHYFSLGDQAGKILLGTACYADNDYVYLYSSLPKKATEQQVNPTGVARLKLADFIGIPSEPIQYWTGSAWSNDAASSAVLFGDGASDMTVTKMLGEPYLVATYMPPLSSKICLRFAAKPEGPWSQAVEVYDCPEGEVKVFSHKNSVYSAKAHVEMSAVKDELIVTYCSNPGEMKHYLAKPDLYYPRFVSVKLHRVIPVGGSTRPTSK